MGKHSTQDYNHWNNECPMYNMYTILGKKWLLIVLQLVKDNHYSYSIIKRKIPEISSKILSDRLQLLCNKGMILKEENTGRYSVTEKGKVIIEALNGMTSSIMKMKG